MAAAAALWIDVGTFWQVNPNLGSRKLHSFGRQTVSWSLDLSLTPFSRSCDFYKLGCDRSLLRSDVHGAESILEVGTAALSQNENAAWQELNNHITARTTWWPDLMFNDTAQRQVSKHFLGIKPEDAHACLLFLAAEPPWTILTGGLPFTAKQHPTWKYSMSRTAFPHPPK